MTQPKYPFPNVIDSSMLASYKSCQALWDYNSVQEWKGSGNNVHLVAGGAFAKGMEVSRRAFYEQGKSNDDSIALGLQALLTTYGDFACPPDSAKSAERMAGAFEFYFANYPLGGDGTEPITFGNGRRGIEFSFAQPLPILNPSTGDPLIYSGRMDAILHYAGGVYITDEKTTTQLGASWSKQWDLRSQFTAYCWGARENGIRTDGVLVRGVSILKTKFDTQQAVCPRPEWQVDRWYEEMLIWVQSMVETWERGKPLHNLDHSCADYGGCAFRQICLSQDPTPWLETYFERRHWDPILGKETVCETGAVVRG